ncbi:hypothetical protein [Tardiphaga robiniae]|uniref:Uncharacterized protein n=1 Tax=Tardiphaga robiniae TaxID=943830 RepID=A0A7G6TTC9_9BRAD|nr:hypothetical protein [Tardiphaga robiniae]QND70011.1 hypothetical protein HB776_01205 [Tardiphaga robiniae]
MDKQRTNYAQARQNLIEYLSRYSHIKDPGLDSVWFIQSSITVDALDAEIRSRLGGHDRLIVTKLESGQHQGWLDPATWAWINPKL